MLVLSTLVMLFLFPAAVYFLTKDFLPELMFPLLLLAAMPSGMTSPFLVELVRGRQSLAILITVFTSLLAPFSIPFVLELLAGTKVSVDVPGMIRALSFAIFMPFLLASLCRKYFSHVIQATSAYYRNISVFLLGLLIFGVVGKQAPIMLSGDSGVPIFFSLGVLIVFFGFLHAFGYFFPFWRDRRDRITASVCLTYMNFTLAVFLADQFFDIPAIMTPVVLAVLPWTTVFPFFRIFADRQNPASLEK
jgi:BASS family bile acid:Na+ symporter